MISMGNLVSSVRNLETILKFFFDGSKCYFNVSEITEEGKNSLDIVVLTVPNEYTRHNRVYSRNVTRKDQDNGVWKGNLGFVPDNVIKKTLQCTTQLVPSLETETREIMRDHLKSHIPELKLHRVNDTCCVDTFFSSVISVRGFTNFNLYCYKSSGLDTIYLQTKRSQSTETVNTFSRCWYTSYYTL